MEESIQDFELNKEGMCTACEEVSLEAEYVHCAICDKKFHVVCPEAKNDDKWATKSMIATYKSPSTKKNFMFLCNCCLTTFETNRADLDGQRLRKMERNMDVINKELQDIKELLSKNIASTFASTSPKDSPRNNIDQSSAVKMNPVSNIWHDTERLASVKAKPTESVLVVNKASDPMLDKANTNLVENLVIESRLPVRNAFKNKSGNLIVVCESEESRDELKEKVSANSNNIEMKTPKENRPSVSIVGLSNKYEKEEVVELLQKQNYFLAQFSESNDINEHIKVYAVKPLRGNQDVFQAFARVSPVIRQGFKTYNDKVTIGLSNCKIYDQYHVKRCNNCQEFGHFYKDCPNAEAPVCAKCGKNHSTKDCTSITFHCVNCAKAEIPDNESQHRSDDPNCPSVRKQQDKIKNTLNMKK